MQSTSCGNTITPSAYQFSTLSARSSDGCTSTPTSFADVGPRRICSISFAWGYFFCVLSRRKIVLHGRLPVGPGTLIGDLTTGVPLIEKLHLRSDPSATPARAIFVVRPTHDS